MVKIYTYILDLGNKNAYNDDINTNKCSYFNISTGKKIHKKAGDLNDGHQKMSFKQAKVGVESLCSGGQYNQPTLECARLER